MFVIQVCLSRQFLDPWILTKERDCVSCRVLDPRYDQGIYVLTKERDCLCCRILGPWYDYDTKMLTKEKNCLSCLILDPWYDQGTYKLTREEDCLSCSVKDPWLWLGHLYFDKRKEMSVLYTRSADANKPWVVWSFEYIPFCGETRLCPNIVYIYKKNHQQNRAFLTADRPE